MDTTLFFPVIFGVLAGWLVNYLSDVLPETRHFSQATCKHCDTAFSIKDYLFLKKCPSCLKGRGIRTWVVMGVSIISSILQWLLPHPKLGYIIGFTLLVYFAVVFVIDLEHRLIMHPVSIVGALFGLGVGVFLHGIAATLIGGLGGIGIMMAFYAFGTLFARIRAKKMRASGLDADDEEALGAGDVILAGVLGLILGWPLIWFGLLLGILLGGIITLPMFIFVLAARKYQRDAWMIFIPYGPFFLISATLIIYLPKLLSILVPK